MEKKITNRRNGGVARMKALKPEARTEIARAAAKARWAQAKMVRATHGSSEHPLVIGDTKIPCFVLEDGRRVITQGGFTDALGMARGGSMVPGMNRLELFVSRKSINPFINSELRERIANPIAFITPDGLRANGFEAELLHDVCEAVLLARSEGKLQRQQWGIASNCELLIRGFARVGIVALVDEATGYQKDREKNALAEILEKFIAKELSAWVPTFSSEFYEQMFRLRGLDFSSENLKRPQYFGTLTNDIVYKRIAPGVLDELKRVTPRTEKGRPSAKYFQSLTSNLGYPKLKEHLGAVVAFMKISKDWKSFVSLLDEHYPRFDRTPMLPMDYDQKEDSGEGI
ncbi:P63C domain-containing protein [Acetobacter sp. UBA5411]|uniref:P63C domain-containing protein n=1 Tax=Acetobacter sp. UBA5411 TaxID=1945905 RepID=UPI0025BC5D21|nr:P63C domain-containing protein [Acetobacter sp. UBA5411]